MKIYPQSLTYVLPLNEDDYVRINIDFTVNKSNNTDTEFINNLLKTAFITILKQFDSI